MREEEGRRVLSTVELWRQGDLQAVSSPETLYNDLPAWKGLHIHSVGHRLGPFTPSHIR